MNNDRYYYCGLCRRCNRSSSWTLPWIYGKKFAVEVDQKEIDVRAELPGNNCGGCGYAGCDGLAKAIAAGEADCGACPVGGAAVAAKIAAIMGAEAGSQERMTASLSVAETVTRLRIIMYILVYRIVL